MTIYDISLPVHEFMVVWPNHPGVTLGYLSHFERGNASTVTHMSLSAHTGTHVDAPCHFLPGGEGVERLDLNTLMGPALVVEALDAPVLSAEVFDRLGIPAGTERLLLHTRNSERWARGEAAFAEDFVGVIPSGAQWLVEHGIRLIGVDYLSVAAWTDLVETHRILLGANVVIVEGLNLTGIAPKEYQFICLPLKIVGRDGSPARAVLVDQEG